MAALKATRSAQYPLSASFTFDIATADTLANTAGAVAAIGSAAAQSFDVIKLPLGARVISGQMTVLVVGNDTGVQTIALGDSASTTRYLSATSIKALARTALVPTGFTGAGEDLRITMVNTNANATTGKVSIDLQYLLDGRAHEAVPN